MKKARREFQGETMTVIAATKNAHKVKEMAALLSDIPDLKLITMTEAGIDADIEENGTTFEENALIKARTVCEATGCIAIADDSGLCVDALDGKPGVFSARYAGELADDGRNNAKLLAELRDVPEEKRTARFCCVIAAAFPDGKTVVAQGECEGRIGFEKKGDGDFGYDPLFYYPPFDKTFAEMTANEKNSVSHRGRAVKAFCEKFFG